MKLKESQLRTIIKQVIAEASGDPVEAITQVQNAVKTLFKYGPAAADALLLASEAVVEDDSMFGATHALDNSAFALQNLPSELKFIENVLLTYKNAMKVAGQASKGEDVPGRGMRNLAEPTSPNGPPKPGMTRSARTAWRRGGGRG